MAAFSGRLSEISRSANGPEGFECFCRSYHPDRTAQGLGFGCDVAALATGLPIFTGDAPADY
jgi:hypothetical protein